MKNIVIHYLVLVLFDLLGYSIPKKWANWLYRGFTISDDNEPFAFGKCYMTTEGRIIEVRKIYYATVTSPHATFLDQYGHERHASLKGSIGRTCGCSFDEPLNVLPYNRPSIPSKLEKAA